MSLILVKGVACAILRMSAQYAVMGLGAPTGPWISLHPSQLNSLLSGHLGLRVKWFINNDIFFAHFILSHIPLADFCVVLIHLKLPPQSLIRNSISSSNLYEIQPVMFWEGLS